MQTVYVVDADSAIRDALKTLLESFDIPVKAYADSNTFLQEVRNTSEGCVLVEAEQPSLNGLGLVRALRKTGNTIPVALLTNNTDSAFKERARRAGAVGVFQKPFIHDELINHVRALVGHAPLADRPAPEAARKPFQKIRQ